jgi:hypothetical protein
MIWARAEIWMPMFDLLQMLHMLYFINIVLPPTPAYMFASFKQSFFKFVPNMFSSVIPQAIMTNKISSPVNSLIGDFMFLRNQGYLYTLTLMMVIFIIVMLLLTKNKWIIKDTAKRHKLKRFWKEVILGSYLHNFIYVLFLPTVFFAFFQMRDYSLYYSIIGFSIFSSLLFLIGFLSIPVYFIYKLKKF